MPVSAEENFPAEASPVADSVDFVMENAVYVGSEQEPAVRTTTTFHQGVVYDDMKSPAETIVFTPEAGRFVVLDHARQTRSELTTAEVATLTRRIAKRSAEHKSPYVRFLGAPELSEEWDPDTGQLLLGSRWLIYQVDARRPQPASIAREYAEFADSYSQLNAMLNPGGIPPMARMKLNSVLAQAGLIPRTLELTLRPSGRDDESVVRLRSEHRLKPVDDEARGRIAKARQAMREYEPVRFRPPSKPAQ